MTVAILLNFKLPDGISISLLLYADDMAILPLPSEGLQNSLNRLYTYCTNWKIEVSTVKTKILIVNTSDKLLKGCRFQYLGTTFSASGNFSCAKEKLRKQDYKSYFPLLN